MFALDSMLNPLRSLKKAKNDEREDV